MSANKPKSIVQQYVQEQVAKEMEPFYQAFGRGTDKKVVSADKHPVDRGSDQVRDDVVQQMLADPLDYSSYTIAECRVLQAELRRIPALEAERDRHLVEHAQCMADMDGEIDRLRAEVEGLRADAERYRKLRAQNHTKTPRVSDRFDPGRGYLPNGLDDALDAIPNEVIGFAADYAARKNPAA